MKTCDAQAVIHQKKRKYYTTITVFDADRPTRDRTSMLFPECGPQQEMKLLLLSVLLREL